MNTYKSYTFEYNFVKEVDEMNVFLPKKPDKEVISIRLPSELLKTVDENAAKADISRNEFINQCIQFAIEHMEEK